LKENESIVRLNATMLGDRRAVFNLSPYHRTISVANFLLNAKNPVIMTIH
jgi:hypothetical protein